MPTVQLPVHAAEAFEAHIGERRYAEELLEAVLERAC